MTDAEVVAALPQLHVFGRVAPEDKVRLARLMQEAGEVVAMTGDAVNDAAALKQADVGVAMGSGSEVTKQAAKMILTDDNFATLVNAVDLGRDIYRRISSYIKLQLTILSSVLQLMLLATIFDINGGVALFPMMLLFCKLFVVVTVVIGFVVDVPDPGVMQRPPRKPGTRIVTRAADRPLVDQRLPHRVQRARPPDVGTRRAEHRIPVDLDDDGVHGRRTQRRQHGPRDAARARVRLGHARVPLPRLDPARLDAHVARRGVERAAADAAHRVAHAAPSGSCASVCRPSPPGSSGSTRRIQIRRLDRSMHPAKATV